MKLSATPTFAAALLMLPGIAFAEGAAGITSTSAEREAGTGLVATAAGREPVERGGEGEVQGEREGEVEAGTGLTTTVDDRSHRQ